jgi:hypothetical protein
LTNSIDFIINGKWRCMIYFKQATFWGKQVNLHECRHVSTYTAIPKCELSSQTCKKQSPQNVEILGSRIPRKVSESEEGLSLDSLFASSEGKWGSLKGWWGSIKYYREVTKACGQFQSIRVSMIYIYQQK